MRAARVRSGKQETAMIIHVPEVLSAEQVSHARKVLDAASWVDGRVTAGYQSSRVKNNHQLPEDSAEARELGDLVVRALERCPLFVTAALPLRVFPPLFNRYDEGMGFGTHLDNSIRQIPGTSHRIRTDVSATLFLSSPEEYDGGELVIEDVYGAHSVKLPAGDMVLYPASSLHEVRPVERGSRLASFFWVQSMVRDDGQRSLLFDLDVSIQRVRQELSEHPAVVSLTNCYHNLLRRFAEL
jgi:PKHD-type hydroxylase